MNSSSRSPAASSRERSPSFLAIFDNSMIFWIMPVTSFAGDLKMRAKLLNPAMYSDMDFDAITAKKDPPKVMIADGRSR